jgi:hypothetical protein
MIESTAARKAEAGTAVKIPLPFTSLVTGPRGLEHRRLWDMSWAPPANLLDFVDAPPDGVPIAGFYAALADDCWTMKLRDRPLSFWLLRLNDRERDELAAACNLRSQPTVATTGSILRMLLWSAPADPLAPKIQDAGEPPNALGENRLTLLARAQEPVAAEAMIFYPLKSNPATLLGKAWKSHESDRACRALQACRL